MEVPGHKCVGRYMVCFNWRLRWRIRHDWLFHYWAHRINQHVFFNLLPHAS